MSRTLSPQQQEQTDNFRAHVARMSLDELVSVFASVEVSRRNLRLAIAQARADLTHHAEMESDAADYRTPRGWRDVSDMLDDIERALGMLS